MIQLFAPEQVRDMDARAFERGVAPLDLMERAAGHLARAVARAGGRRYGLRVAILCGAGNNGGDGLAAARRLRAWGADPAVCLVAGTDRLSDDAQVQLRRWRALGGRVHASAEEALAGSDVAVDCLLGTGSRGAPREPYRTAVESLNRFTRTVVACDVPTGADADTGAVAEPAVRADLTVTLGAHKRGLWLWPARRHCGTLVLGELGIVDPGDAPVALALEHSDAARLLPPLRPEVEKRGRGVVLVVAGSPGMGGAAALVARGAMAGGAGLVSVATEGAVRDQVAAAVPEALTVALPLGDPDAAVEELERHLPAADAVVLGPGLGRAPAVMEVVHRLVRMTDVPLVLDADGLNAFRGQGDRLADHKAPLLVVTPHVREYARLRGRGPEEVWPARATEVPACARRWRAVVVAKGPGSIVAAPDGRVWVNATGAPALASGGTGDVLAGMLAAVLAQHPDAERVAAVVHLHGIAGQYAVPSGGVARPPEQATPVLPLSGHQQQSRAARSATASDVIRAVARGWQVLEEAAR